MPEAVNSHSTTAFPRQPLPSEIQDGFEDVSAMLRAYNEMTAGLLNSGEDYSKSSYGIFMIHKLIMERLDEVSEAANPKGQAEKPVHDMARQRPSPSHRAINPDLMHKISQMIVVANADAGRSISDDDLLDQTVQRYNEMIGRLDNGQEEAENFLPWLEGRIKKEAGTPKRNQGTANRIFEIRSRFINDGIGQGYNVSEISQAINMKRKTVERYAARLKALSEDDDHRIAG